MMAVHPSGYYAWLETPHCPPAIDDKRLLGYIKQSWLESGSVYGYRKVRDDLPALGETCGKHRVYRLMRQERLRSQTGYHRRPSPQGGPAAVMAPNHLQRQLDVHEPNRVWVTDITYIRTQEGWLFLPAVQDLLSDQFIGWSMGQRMDRDLAIYALLMAVWRRQPQSTVMVHSDQGSQFSSYDWKAFLKIHDLQPSMSRRGNRHDKVVAEIFFQLLKRERTRRKTYATRKEARQDVFDYIEMFYNHKRRHGVGNRLSPLDYEKQYFERLASV